MRVIEHLQGTVSDLHLNKLTLMETVSENFLSLRAAVTGLYMYVVRSKKFE